LNKIVALYINELIKISKKISILIMLIIMVAGVFGLGGLLKLQEKSMAGYQDQGSMEQEWMLEEMERVKADLSGEKSNLESRLADLDPQTEGPAIMAAKENIASLEDQIETYQTAINEKIMILGSNNYLSNALYKIQDIKYELRQLENTPESNRDDTMLLERETLEQQLSGYENVIREKSFSSYLLLENDFIESDSSLTESQKEIQKERLRLWQQLDSSGGLENDQTNYQVENLLSQYETLSRSLDEKLDYTSYEAIIPLTPDKYDELENKLAVLMYQIEHNLVSTQSSNPLAQSALDSMLGFGSFMIVLMMLILAGGSISQEIATGSIKSLIISPARRWKIFTAKVMSMISVSLAALLVLYVVAMLSHGIFFGFSSGQPYIFAVQGNASSIGFGLFQLAGLFVRLIDILIFMALAMMLSVLTRNTAAAVGISMAAYVGSSLAGQLLMLLPKAEWLKFLPITNLNLLDKFFPFRSLTSGFSSGISGMQTQSITSLNFSLIYLAVVFVCMMYTALDSFNRRDIK
jgi:ABC-2 type transport system permease protein